MIVAAPIWDHGKLEKNPRLAFVIMPFRPKWSGYVYNELLKPIVVAAGLLCQRADEMMGRNVLDDIWRAIYGCRLVIAEITEYNANVYYELGIAHTLGKNTILLTQNVDVVPFDLRQQRLVEYTDDLPGYRKLQNELPRHISAILSEPVDELYHLRSSIGGYIVDRAFMRISLRDSQFESGDLVDEMNIIGTRENIVLINKAIEHAGVVTGMTCNHRFARSTSYADLVRQVVLFEPPYVQIGTRERVELRYTIERGFIGDHCRWNYDITVETSRIDFELRAPMSFTERVRLTEYVKPVDNTIQVLTPVVEEGFKVFRGTVGTPQIGAVYALVWS
jgi:hypothetical protein